MSFIVAIDGPAGSGKGTVTKILAEKLGLIGIDTGATYRALTVAVIKNNLTIDDKEEIINLSKNAKIDINDEGKVFLNQEDVSKRIRDTDVSNLVSFVSSIVEVRLNMVKLQRKLAFR